METRELPIRRPLRQVMLDRVAMNVTQGHSEITRIADRVFPEPLPPDASRAMSSPPQPHEGLGASPGTGRPVAQAPFRGGRDPVKFTIAPSGALRQHVQYPRAVVGFSAFAPWATRDRPCRG
jgi:hypothetical protein